MKGKKGKLVSASRKTAKANAVIMPGTGRVRVNSVPVELLPLEMARERVLAPLELAGETRGKVDINVTVSGGGYMGQADATAIAITRAIREYTKGKEKEEFVKMVTNYDRHLLAGDSRRKEPKKFGGRGARSKKQKSYR
jgi:small subunit ribosomal protein S9